MFKRILVAYDGSEGAKLALAKAVEISKAAKADIHILAVGRIPEYAETVSEVEEEKQQAQNLLFQNHGPGREPVQATGLITHCPYRFRQARRYDFKNCRGSGH